MTTKHKPSVQRNPKVLALLERYAVSGDALPFQRAIAAECGVTQATVSRTMHSSDFEIVQYHGQRFARFAIGEES